MSHGNVIRRALSFPGTGPSGSPTLYPIPDPRSSDLPYVYPSGDAFDPRALTTYGEAGIKVDIPPGTVAIGIAPDSLVHCCDISLTGIATDAVRVAPGLPMLGCRGEQRAIVTLPRVPVAVSSGADVVSLGAIGPGWPLRLEFFIGEVLPIRNHRRAPMLGAARVVSSSSGERRVAVCVDGRRKISILVTAITVGATINVKGYASHLPSLDFDIAMNDAGDLSVAMTSGEIRMFTLEVPAAVTTMDIVINGAAVGPGEAIVDIRAED